jgi:hypothetical protein
MKGETMMTEKTERADQPVEPMRATNPPLEGVKRVGPFVWDFDDDGVYEHMGEEYGGADAVWLWTAPIETQQAMERADFAMRVCREAQDIAAAAQEELRKERERCGPNMNRAARQEEVLKVKRDAVLKERERCAKICEADPFALHDHAAAIRKEPT